VVGVTAPAVVADRCDHEGLPTLPDGRLVLAPHSGHLVPQEDEELLVDVINSLVAEVR
jgi:hypothetical protein